jgi:hypothetical protein
MVKRASLEPQNPEQPMASMQPSSSAWRRMVASAEPEDGLILAYLLLLLAVVVNGEGPKRAVALPVTAVVLALYLLLQGFAHSLPATAALREFVRRISLLVGILGSFLELQYVLPTASRRILDSNLYHFDLGAFGLEPAMAWDKYVTPQTTEWFSFFYFNYYALIGAFLVPFFFFVGKSRISREFTFGICFMFCMGHTIYLIVPAYGPYSYLAGQFQHPLEGAFWWPLVARTVSSGGGAARTDVFPSLHTGVPTFLTLFSFRNRNLPVFKFGWPLLALAASQIIGATMFLRWHYLIDIFAGMSLAYTASRLSAYLAQRPRTLLSR